MDDRIWLFLLLLGLAFLIWRWLSRRDEGSSDPLPTTTPRVPDPPSARKPPPILPPRSPGRGGKKAWKRLTPEEVTEGETRRKREAEQDRRDRQEAQRQAAKEKLLKEEQERKDSFDRVETANAEEEERRRRLAARNARDGDVRREFQHYINQPIPAHIRRSMQAFRDGEFVGSDRSPLDYVGYHVGKARGLAFRDREQRLVVCFRIDIKRDLFLDYRDWGGPASRQRLSKMRDHLRMLAQMRGNRPGYEIAVAEWNRDRDWLGAQLEDLVEKFEHNGVTW